MTYTPCLALEPSVNPGPIVLSSMDIASVPMLSSSPFCRAAGKGGWVQQ
jgi:hypothetical protein